MKKGITVSDYVAEQHIELLAMSEKSELGRALIEACRRRSAKVVADMRAMPKIGPEKIQEDIRYKLGQADEVEFLLDLVKECQREITKPGRAVRSTNEYS